MILGLGTGLLFAGLVTLLASIRFTRKGEGRRCGKCDYDLAGMTVQTRRCPECGARLGARNIINNHEADRLHAARPLIRLLGGVTTCVGVVMLLVVLDGSSSRIPYTPNWYLLKIDLPRGIKSENQSVMIEIMDRLNAGELTASQSTEAARTIIGESSHLKPRQYLSQSGSYGNELLHALMKNGVITVADLSASPVFRGEWSIRPRPSAWKGQFRWGLKWNSNYIFAMPLPQTQGMNTILEIDKVRLDGQEASTSVTQNRLKTPLFAHMNEVMFLPGGKNDHESNPVAPGTHELEVEGLIRWMDMIDGVETEVAQSPITISGQIVVEEHDATYPEFSRSPEHSSTLVAELADHSYLTRDGRLHLAIGEDCPATLHHRARVQLRLDAVNVQNINRFHMDESNTSSFRRTQVRNRNRISHRLQYGRVPDPAIRRIPDIGTMVTVRLTPEFNLQEWYDAGGTENDIFLDLPLEFEVPVVDP